MRNVEQSLLQHLQPKNGVKTAYISNAFFVGKHLKYAIKQNLILQYIVQKNVKEKTERIVFQAKMLPIIKMATD